MELFPKKMFLNMGRSDFSGCHVPKIFPYSPSSPKGEGLGLGGFFEESLKNNRCLVNMGVEPKNRSGLWAPPNHPILRGFSLIFTIRFGGFSHYFWKHPYVPLGMDSFFPNTTP